MEKEHPHTQVQEVKWKPPVGDFFKVNFDGACRKFGPNGIGIVVRDNRGRIVAFLAEPTQQSMDCDLVECRALWKAILFARDLGIRNIHVEGDSLTVINAVKSDDEDR
ncbi:hypothetical protein U1Q18_034262 [Sarracenia purpurea var. burkii]